MDNKIDNKIGVYLRISTLDQSTDLQRTEIDEYIQTRGWGVPSYYEDLGISGTTANRPSLKRMIADAQEGKLKVIICWKLDRLFRSLRELVNTIQLLKDHGVQFISLKDHIDLSTAQGMLLMQLLGSFAEFEASLIRERVRAGLAAAKKRGRRLGRPRTINREMVQHLRDKGLSMGQIAKELGVTKSGVSKTLRQLAQQST